MPLYGHVKIEACYIEYKDNLRYPLNVFGAQLKKL